MSLVIIGYSSAYHAGVNLIPKQWTWHVRSALHWAIATSTGTEAQIRALSKVLRTLGCTINGERLPQNFSPFSIEARTGVCHTSHHTSVRGAAGRYGLEINRRWRKFAQSNQRIKQILSRHSRSIHDHVQPRAPNRFRSTKFVQSCLLRHMRWLAGPP